MVCYMSSFLIAGVAELVDAPDSKSGEGNLVWVRVPPPAPHKSTANVGVFLVYTQRPNLPGHDPLAVLRVSNIRKDRKRLLGTGLLDQPLLDLGLLPSRDDHHSCALLQVSVRDDPAYTPTTGNYGDLV